MKGNTTQAVTHPHLLSYIIVYICSSALFWVTLGFWIFRFDELTRDFNGLTPDFDPDVIGQMTQYVLISKVILIAALAVLLIDSIFIIIRAEKYKKLLGLGLLIVALIQIFWGLAVGSDNLGAYLGSIPGY